MGKIMSAKEASMLIKGGDTIAVGGFVGCNHPEELTIALEKRFLETGCPRWTRDWTVEKSIQERRRIL